MNHIFLSRLAFSAVLIVLSFVLKGGDLGMALSLFVLINGILASCRFMLQRNLKSFMMIFLPAAIPFLFIFGTRLLPWGLRVNEFAFGIEYMLRRREFENDVRIAGAKNPDVHYMEWRPWGNGWTPMFVYSSADLPRGQWGSGPGCNRIYLKLDKNFYALVNDCF